MSRAQSSSNDVDVDLGRLFASLKENWRLIVLAAVVVAGGAFLLASLAAPLYRAETRIVIEMRESVYTRPQNEQGDRPILDDEGVASQVEIISSTDILARVAKKLDLAHNKEIVGGEQSTLGSLLVLAGLRSDPRNVAPEQRVVEAMRENLEVYRVNNSRVIVISFSSEDPKLAAKVPNAIADAYLAVQRQAKEESNTDATKWLQPEISELRLKVKAAESRVADYRARSDLLIGQDNTVLPSQQLSEVSSELSRVRAGRAAAQAKVTAMRTALKDGASLETLPDVLDSNLIQNLRERQVALKAQIADLSTTLLGNHPRIRALRSQLADLNEQIRAEAQKVLDGLETEVETARVRVRELTNALNEVKAEAARADKQQVELRALEREATAARDLLESYLTRYREASSRGERNYLPVDARVFSRAVPPSEPYFPKVVPITLAALAATLLLAAVITLLRELFSGRAMRPAAAPVEPIEEVVMPAGPESADRAGEGNAPDPAEPHAPVPGEIGVEAAVDRLAADDAGRILFVSPEGDEGAAASILVARRAADAGLRVILVDITSSGVASQPMLESTSYPGITNLLVSEARFGDVIHGDLYSDCHVIPIGTADLERAMRAADRLPIVLTSLSTAYDAVVVECGAATAEEIERLADDDTAIMVSVLGASEGSASATAREIEARGLGTPDLIRPTFRPPHSAPPGRSAA